MSSEYLMYLLKLWSKWMHFDDNGLGYPKKSLGMSTGGASTDDSFEEMFEAAELKKIQTIDAIISSLKKEERDAVYARFLGSKKPHYYEMKLQMAFHSIMNQAKKRLELF